MGMGTSRSPVLNISDVVAALVDFSLTGIISIDQASPLCITTPQSAHRFFSLIPVAGLSLPPRAFLL